MGEIVNLRLARKRRARQDAEQQAQQNRVAFGRTKTERRLADAEREKAGRGLDGHRLKPDEPEAS